MATMKIGFSMLVITFAKLTLTSVKTYESVLQSLSGTENKVG